MSNLSQIVAQRADFDTCQFAAWTDGFPLVGLAGAGGVVAGPANVGNGSLSVAAVAGGARRGVYLCTVAGTQAGLASYSVTDPDGDVVGVGVTGLPLDAAGLRVTLAQGAIPFGAGDTFAVAVLTAPLDLTGLAFTLAAQLNASSATRMLTGASAPADGSQATLLVDPVRGALANRQLQPAMGRLAVGDYPYTLIATDPAVDPAGEEPVIVFYGTIRHRAVLTPSLSA